MTTTGWTRQQLLAAFALYCQLPFGRLHARNPQIIALAKQLGRTPSALAMKLTNIASLDPSITSTGRKGLSGASAADRALWQEMQNDWQSFAIESQKVLSALAIKVDADASINAGITPEVDADDHTGLTKTALVSVRVGQAFFRRAVLSAYGSRCCISGLVAPRLLVASHIVPWSVDAKNRLNPRNGLCLSALHDKAFDAGLITIADDLTLKVSRKGLKRQDQFFASAIMAYDGVAITLPKKFAPAPELLAFHRAEVFESRGGWR